MFWGSPMSVDKEVVKALQDRGIPYLTAIDIWHENIKVVIAQHDAALKQKLLEALPKRDLFEPITKRKVAAVNDLVRIDVDADRKGSLVFVQDNGYNQAIDKVLEVIQSIFKEEK